MEVTTSVDYEELGISLDVKEISYYNKTPTVL